MVASCISKAVAEYINVLLSYIHTHLDYYYIPSRLLLYIRVCLAYIVASWISNAVAVHPTSRVDANTACSVLCFTRHVRVWQWFSLNLIDGHRHNKTRHDTTIQQNTAQQGSSLDDRTLGLYIIIHNFMRVVLVEPDGHCHNKTQGLLPCSRTV